MTTLPLEGDITVSDENLDVAPAESVVGLPSEYEDGIVSLDQPAPHEAEPEAEIAEDEAEPEAEPEETEEEELLEFDFGGNKFSVKKSEVPPELAEKIGEFSKDLWADYTKKSQANAETQKALRAREEVVEKITSLSTEALEAFSRGKHLKSEIEQLSTVNLQSLWQSNPDRARQISDALAAKQAELQGIIQTVDQYENDIQQTRQAELERRAGEGRQVLDRKYKGFSSEIAPKLEEYAVKNGISPDEAKSWALTPVVAEMAYKAMLYDQMQSAKAPKSSPKQAAPVRAIKNAGANKAPVSPNNMSFSELGKILGIK